MKQISYLITLFFCASLTAQNTKTAGENFLAANKNKAGVTTTSSGLQYLMLTKGNGAKPKATDIVKVNFELKLIDGTIVQSSSTYGGAMDLGVADLIPGWQEALQLMPIGSKYRFFIPSDLAYGEDGGAGGKIKPNEMIIAEVELLGIKGVVNEAVIVSNNKIEDQPKVDNKTTTAPKNVNGCWGPLYTMAMYFEANKDAVIKKNIAEKLAAARALKDSCYKNATAAIDKDLTSLFYCFLNDKIIAAFITPKEANDKKTNEIVITALKERLATYEDFKTKLPFRFSIGGIGSSYIKIDNEENLAYVNYYLYLCNSNSDKLLANSYLENSYAFADLHKDDKPFIETFLKIEAAYKTVYPNKVIANTPATVSALTYLGDDEIENKQDGYASQFKTTGFEAINGTYYFTTPNGHIYQTKGTQASTSVLKTFPPQHIVFFTATNKHLIYGYSPSGNLYPNMYRYNPASGKGEEDIFIPTPSSAPLSAKIEIIYGERNIPTSTNEIFINYEKDKAFFRTYKDEVFVIYALSDKGNNKADYLWKDVLSTKEMSISPYTQVASLKNQVYFNGTFKPTGAYETGAMVIENSEAAPGIYKFKTSFILKNKGLDIYPNFFRTKENIYSFVNNKDSIGGDRYMLYFYEDKMITGEGNYLNYKGKYFNAQAIGDDIYVYCNNKIWRFDETESYFEEIYTDELTDIGWNNIQKNKKILQSGVFLMHHKGENFTIYDTEKATTQLLKTPVVANEPNREHLDASYVYAGSSAFYFMDKVDGKEVFTKYDPGKKIYTPIVFPEFEKQTFAAIKAIYQLGNQFIFLTSYMGKKDKPVYKMFRYTE